MQANDLIKEYGDKEVFLSKNEVKLSGVNDLTIGYDFYQGWYPSYPSYPNVTYIKSEDDYSKAFRVAKMLLKKNYLVSNRLKDFIDLVESVAKEL